MMNRWLATIGCRAAVVVTLALAGSAITAAPVQAEQPNDATAVPPSAGQPNDATAAPVRAGLCDGTRAAPSSSDLSDDTPAAPRSPDRSDDAPAARVWTGAAADATAARAAELRRDARQMRDLARILDEQGKADVAAQLRADAQVAEAEADRLAAPAADRRTQQLDGEPTSRRHHSEGRRAPLVESGARGRAAQPNEPAGAQPPDSADESLAAVDLLYEAAAKLRAAGMRREAARVTRLALQIEAGLPRP